MIIQTPHDLSETEERPSNLISFSMGWIFWSLCTTLSLIALLIKANVATADAALTVVSNAYHDTVHAILILLPQGFGIQPPRFTPFGSAIAGLYATIFTPSLLLLRRYMPPLRGGVGGFSWQGAFGCFVIAILGLVGLLAVYYWWGYIWFSEYPLFANFRKEAAGKVDFDQISQSIQTTLTLLVLLFVSSIVFVGSWHYVHSNKGNSKRSTIVLAVWGAIVALLDYGKNLLGAALILTSLALTGFFELVV